MFERIKTFWKQLFTTEKFPGENRKSLGGKRIGDVYDIDYEIEENGEAKIEFVKKDQHK
jgi:hypothetical protein